MGLTEVCPLCKTKGTFQIRNKILQKQAEAGCPEDGTACFLFQRDMKRFFLQYIQSKVHTIEHANEIYQKIVAHSKKEYLNIPPGGL